MYVARPAWRCWSTSRCASGRTLVDQLRDDVGVQRDQVVVGDALRPRRGSDRGRRDGRVVAGAARTGTSIAPTASLANCRFGDQPGAPCGDAEHERARAADQRAVEIEERGARAAGRDVGVLGHRILCVRRRSRAAVGTRSSSGRGSSRDVVDPPLGHGEVGGHRSDRRPCESAPPASAMTQRRTDRRRRRPPRRLGRALRPRRRTRPAVPRSRHVLDGVAERPAPHLLVQLGQLAGERHSTARSPQRSHRGRRRCARCGAAPRRGPPFAARRRSRRCAVPDRARARQEALEHEAGRVEPADDQRHHQGSGPGHGGDRVAGVDARRGPVARPGSEMPGVPASVTRATDRRRRRARSSTSCGPRRLGVLVGHRHAHAVHAGVLRAAVPCDGCPRSR